MRAADASTSGGREAFLEEAAGLRAENRALMAEVEAMRTRASELEERLGDASADSLAKFYSRIR